MALPLFVTGQPKKEFNFSWLLTEDPVTLIDRVKILAGLPFNESIKDILKEIFNVSKLLYISQLAQSVNLPEDSLHTESVQAGMVEFPIPSKFPLEPIQVTYVEDELNSVYSFHKSWQQSARSGDGLSLLPLSPLSLGAAYSPVVPTGVSKIRIDIPTGSSYYPRVFPTKVSRSTANKSGAGYGIVQVTYSRVPRVSKWKPCTESSGYLSSPLEQEIESSKLQ
jgi:hypothetical protein